MRQLLVDFCDTGVSDPGVGQVQFPELNQASETGALTKLAPTLQPQVKRGMLRLPF